MKPKKVPFRKGFSVIAQNKRSQAACMVIAPGKKQGGPDNNHRGADQWLFVLSGKGSVTVEGRKFTLEASSLVLIERGQSHEIQNLGTTDLVTLNFYLPPAYTKKGNELSPAKPK
jgi:mannose-6-phosphate isomerase-like protein (cupin superfamily)